MDTDTISVQRRIEMVKAFAYGETPEQVADAEGVSVELAKDVQETEQLNILKERRSLIKGGYINE